MNLSLTERPIATIDRAPARDVAELYRLHGQKVERWAGWLGGPLLDVEDLVQEVFLTAHRLYPKFRGECQVTTWLYRLTANVVRHRRRSERFRRWLGGSAEDVAGHLSTPSRQGPVEDLERKQATLLCYEALDRLSEKERALIVLFELEERTGQEIAALTGRKLATVWVDLHRARKRFSLELSRLDKGGNT